jgi:soluble lytic murein transglycosylase-like protein
VALAVVAPRPRSEARRSDVRRCTGDGAFCITLASYVPDVCRTIEAVARSNTLDPNFLARLIWKESLFDAGAVSPKGAQGIAQFIPSTAKLRGLKDAFNPAEALAASAAHLPELTRAYGHIGVAAAAYDAGEGRVDGFVARSGGLAAETRAYVEAITGHSAETWRDAPPKAPPDLALAADQPFQAACVAQASSRNVKSFRTEPPVLPWGVVLASNRDSDGARRQVARLKNRHAAVLSGEPVAYTRGRRAGMPRSLVFAQVGRESRAEADALCGRLQAAGADCMVLRN